MNVRMLALCAVFLTGCQNTNTRKLAATPEASKTIHLGFTGVGDLFLIAKKGDTIKWKQGTQTAPVQFKHGVSPCAASSPAGECQITAHKGYYAYNCTGCTDPGIGVGSDDGITTTAYPVPKAILPRPYANPPAPQVWCDTSTNTAHVDPITGRPGDSFEYQYLGSEDFSINLANGTCAQSDGPHNIANAACTLKPSYAPQPSYKVHVNGCANDGTGSLTPPGNVQ